MQVICCKLFEVEDPIHQRRYYMADIRHGIGIQSSAAKVYEALTSLKGLSAWWTETTSGAPDQLGGVITFEFQKLSGEVLGAMDFQVVELNKDSLVRWICKSGPEEWLNTEVRFDLSKDDDFTLVQFSHLNWPENTDFIYHCSMKWAVFLLSLKSLLTHGKGQPSPYDLKIDRHN